MSVTVTWLNHASFRIESDRTVYIDPWKLPSGSKKADLIIVSHSHYDHCSPKDVSAVRSPQTVVLAPPDAAAQLGGEVVEIAPGDRHESSGVVVEAVAAYNPGKQFHPQANNWVGVVVELDGKRIYYAGDTDQIPEMADVGQVDLALLPVGGTYTMSAAEAAAACKLIKPRRALPYHWGDIVGAISDAEVFAEQAPCSVTVLRPGESLELG